jgi:cell division protein FtsA
MKVVPFPSSSAPGGSSHSATSSTIAALDIGSTKICCLIGQLEGRKRRAVDETVPQIKVIGSGHCRSVGVRGGAIIDLDAAERSLRTAIDQAERMAGHTISEVYVNMSGGRTTSVHVTGQVPLASGPVTEADKRRAMMAAMSKVETQGRAVIHASVFNYRLDDARGVRDPQGLHGSALTAELNVVMADPRAIANLGLLLERCHLDAGAIVAAPYAAARSVLLADEMELGVALIELGGGTTSYAVFNEGALVHASMIPVGSHHVTTDIARGLNTTIAHAERVKTLWGSTVPAQLDERELIACPILGETGSEAVKRVPRSMICGVVRPRMEEVLEIIRDRLHDIPAARHIVRRVVLSGGGSQLNGVEQLAGEILSRGVRVAKPARFEGLPDALSTPGFSVASGLLRYGLAPDQQTANLGTLIADAGHDAGYFRRVGQWLKESF